MPNVLICSAGRRGYLVRWFKEALAKAGTPGSIILADADRYAAARADADDFVQMPRFSDTGYTSALAQACEQKRADIAVSVNDYELSIWSGLEDLSRLGTMFVRLEPKIQSIVEDKLLLASNLAGSDFPAPPTVTAAQWMSDESCIEVFQSERLILKNRFGSGSSGFRVTTVEHLPREIEDALGQVHGRSGEPLLDTTQAAEALVIQPLLQGHEFGIDVVCDMKGQGGWPLARRKLSMRHGETDSAITVPSDPWREYAQEIAKVIPHLGIIDTDAIQTDDGRIWTIDINPRFGGGYPFSHVAGADVPSAYINWLLNRTDVENFFQYVSGHVSAKRLDIALVETADAES